MRELIIKGVAEALVKLTLLPVSIGILWLFLVKFELAKTVGFDTPTLGQIALIALVIAFVS